MNKETMPKIYSRNRNHICAACDSKETYLRRHKDGYRQMWAYHDGYWMCRKCYRKYVYGPAYNPIYNAIYHLKSIMYKDKRINVGIEPRKGICSWCGFEGITQ